MKKVLYVLNDCMRKFSYERTEGLSRAFRALEEPVDLYVVRSDGYSEFAPDTPCLSAGCVMSDPAETKTLDQYVELADARMYAEKNAKRAGREENT